MATAFEIMDIKYGSCGCPLRSQLPSISFTVDATVSQEFSFQLLGGSSFTARINYGDGQPEVNHTGSEFNAGYVWAAPGIYLITVEFNLNIETVMQISFGVNQMLRAVDVSAASGLVIFNATTQKLSSFLPSSVLLLQSVELAENQLTTAAVNQLLQYLDSTGVVNGSVSTIAQIPAAPPSGAGLIAKTNLEIKGWTVATD